MLFAHETPPERKIEEKELHLRNLSNRESENLKIIDQSPKTARSLRSDEN